VDPALMLMARIPHAMATEGPLIAAEMKPKLNFDSRSWSNRNRGRGHIRQIIQ
jgi:hypothetical protein